MRALLVVLVFGAAAAAADPFNGLRFVDGRERTGASFVGQPALVIRFCATSPLSCVLAEFEIKAIDAAIEAERLSATLVLAVPNATPDELRALAQRFAAPNALWASDVVNQRSIRPTNMGYEDYVNADGTFMPAPEGPLATTPAGPRFKPTTEPVLKLFRTPGAGARRFPVERLTDPHVQELWWMLERRKTDAIKVIIAAAKRKDAVGTDAATLLAAIKSTLDARQEKLIAEPPSMAAIEGLEALLADAEVIELKPAKERLAVLLKAKELKDELKARRLHRECVDAFASATKEPEREATRQKMAWIAEHFPDTVYGKRAAATP